MVVTPVPPFATASCVPDQFELLMVDAVARDPSPDTCDDAIETASLCPTPCEFACAVGVLASESLESAVRTEVPLTPAAGSPVQFVSVPPEGVPRAPPLTTSAPAEPTFVPSAVGTPVPRLVTPVPPLVAPRGVAKVSAPVSKLRENFGVVLKDGAAPGTPVAGAS